MYIDIGHRERGVWGTNWQWGVEGDRNITVEPFGGKEKEYILTSTS